MATVKNKSGQGILEFVFAFLILMSILIFYIQMGLGMLSSNFADYASFMASRALLTSGEKEAQQTVNELLGTTEQSHLNFLLQLVSPAQGKDSFVVRLRDKSGIQIPYRIPMYVPFLGQGTGGEPLKLISESYHGEEVNRDQCRQDLIRTVSRLNNERDFNECGF